MCLGVDLVDLGGPLPKVLLRAQRAGCGFVSIEHAVLIGIVGAGVEKARILCADGQFQLVLYGVKIDEIPQYMAFDRKQETMATAFQSLEQVCPAKTHQPVTGNGK